MHTLVLLGSSWFPGFYRGITRQCQWGPKKIISPHPQYFSQRLGTIFPHWYEKMNFNIHQKVKVGSKLLMCPKISPKIHQFSWVKSLWFRVHHVVDSTIIILTNTSIKMRGFQLFFRKKRELGKMSTRRVKKAYD